MVAGGAKENAHKVREIVYQGTDFNKLTRRQIQHLEDWINSIHRESLNGETAYAYDSFGQPFPCFSDIISRFQGANTDRFITIPRG